jgi:hypothetical protein
MTSRFFAAGIVVLGIGAVMVPVETLAGSSGLAAPSSLARGPVRPSFPAPHLTNRFLPRGEFPRHIGGFRMSKAAERRGLGFPLWWGYESSFPNYYPSEYEVPYGEFPYPYPPFDNFSERSRPVVIRPSECRTDSQKVPSETGGERTINITRCY